MWLAPSVALAESGDAVRSRKHYEAGRALYDVGNYQAALAEFSAGYELVPRPLFLLNIGQCHRKLGNYDKARESFDEFLKVAPKDEPARARAVQLISEVERERAAAPKRPVSETAAGERAAISLEAPRVVEPRAFEPGAAEPRSVEPRAVEPNVPPPVAAPTARRRRLWIGLGVGGALAAVAIGVSVGLVLGLSSTHYPNSQLGTFGFGR
jgi:tetratricopeptide (TPR) repeat protein